MYVLFVICDCGVPVKLYNVKYTCFNYKTINIHTKMPFCVCLIIRRKSDIHPFIGKQHYRITYNKIKLKIKRFSFTRRFISKEPYMVFKCLIVIY